MTHRVTDRDTAIELGSGDVPVLATPRLIAWMEAATVKAAAGWLAPGETTVGTAVRIEHRRATPVGGSVEISVGAPVDRTGRRFSFPVEAIDGAGDVVAVGEVDRAIVNREDFLGRLSR